MFSWKRLLYAFVALVILFLVSVSLVLPGIVIERAQNWVADEVGRTLQIGSLSVNPATLTVVVRELSLSETDKVTPFIAWQELKVSFSLESLFQRAPIVDEIQLDALYLQLERLAENQFNFSDLIPESGEQTDVDPSGKPFQYSINNLTLNNGRLELVDHSIGEEIKHVIRDLDLALPAIGNLPYMVDSPIRPMLHAVVNDAPVDIEGTLRPFSTDQEMRFNLSLANIDLPFYLGYVPVELPIQLRNGHLSFDLDVVYRMTEDSGPELAVSGHIDLSALDIWDRRNEQLFFLPLLQVDIAPTRPLVKDIHFSTLRIYNLEVQLHRDQQGIWNHSRIQTAEEQPPEAKQIDEEPALPLKLLVDDVEIRDGVVYFRDDVPAGGFQTTAREINIDLEKFALDTTESIPVSLALETKYKEIIKVNGHFLLDPFTLALQTEFDNLLVAIYEPYYHEAYKGPLGGTLTVRTHLDVTPEQSLLVTQGNIQWHNAYMAFNEKEGIGADLVDVANLSFNMAENRLEIESARYENGRMNFSRDKEGNWSLLSRNFPILDKLTEAPDEPPPPPVKQEGPEFSYLIGELAFIDWEFDVSDHMPPTPVHLQARDFNLNLRNLAAPDKVQSPFKFSTAVGERGQIQLQGEASLAEQSVKVAGNLKNISLTTFAPYLAEQANIVLKNGDLNSTLQTSVITEPEGSGVIFSGDIGISRFHLLDGTHREDLLKWDNLQFDNIQGRMEPLSVTIDAITLNDYFAKVLIDEEARLNLVEAFQAKNTTADGNTPESAESTKEDDSTVPVKSLPDIRIDTVVLQGGQIDFTDRNLLKFFHADMQELGGRISGLSSDSASRAEVDLRGSLRQQSPLNISGTVNPLAEKPFLDLMLDFRDIEMGPMSPYSGTYTGYLIEKGKLNLALKYHVENDQLQASNDVFLDQFTFGESVESDKATGLPVKLAVALLKDRNGEIHLDIPVNGSLDDPQFSVGGVIWTLIKNLLVKAATSPMALLGALVGGGSDDDFSSVSFASGSSQLTVTEQDKLQRIVGALHDRPSLKIEVKGYVDPQNDPEGFRREQLRLKVQRAKYEALVDDGALADGETVETLTVTDEEYPDYLWQVYQQADFPKPLNFIGRTKKLSVEEQEKLIYANTDVGPEQLANLAQTRAQSVMKYMIEDQRLPRERVFLTTADFETPPAKDEAVRSRVEFDISVD